MRSLCNQRVPGDAEAFVALGVASSGGLVEADRFFQCLHAQVTNLSEHCVAVSPGQSLGTLGVSC